MTCRTPTAEAAHVHNQDHRIGSESPKGFEDVVEAGIRQAQKMFARDGKIVARSAHFKLAFVLVTRLPVQREDRVMVVVACIRMQPGSGPRSGPWQQAKSTRGSHRQATATTTCAEGALEVPDVVAFRGSR